MKFDSSGSILVLLSVTSLYFTSSVLAVDQETRRRWNKQHKELDSLHQIKSTPGVYKPPYATFPYQPIQYRESTRVNKQKAEKTTKKADNPFTLKDDSRFTKAKAIMLLKNKNKEFLKTQKKYLNEPSNSQKHELNNSLFVLSPYKKAYEISNSNTTKSSTKTKPDNVRSLAIEAVKISSELKFLVDLIETKPNSENHRRLAVMMIRDEIFRTYWVKQTTSNEDIIQNLAQFQPRYKRLKYEVNTLAKQIRHLNFVSLFDKKAYRIMSKSVDLKIDNVKLKFKKFSDSLSQYLDKDEEAKFLYTSKEP